MNKKYLACSNGQIVSVHSAENVKDVFDEIVTIDGEPLGIPYELKGNEVIEGDHVAYTIMEVPDWAIEALK